MKKKQTTPTPKEDPRYTGAEGQMRRTNAQRPNGYEEYQGSLTDAKDHPANTVPQATEHYDGALKNIYDTLGPKTTYQMETSGMNNSVGISDKVPRRDE